MTALTLEGRLRLQNGALAKIIILIQNMDSVLTCFIRGGRMVLRVPLFVQHEARQEANVATQGGWLPSSVPPLPLLITSEGSYVKLIK